MKITAEKVRAAALDVIHDTAETVWNSKDAEAQYAMGYVLGVCELAGDLLDKLISEEE